MRSLYNILNQEFCKESTRFSVNCIVEYKTDINFTVKLNTYI